MYTFMSINGSSGSCHTRRDAELIPICNRLLTDLHVVRKMKRLPLALLDAHLHANAFVNVYHKGNRSYALESISTFNDKL